MLLAARQQPEGDGVLLPRSSRRGGNQEAAGRSPLPSLQTSGGRAAVRTGSPALLAARLQPEGVGALPLCSARSDCGREAAACSPALLAAARQLQPDTALLLAELGQPGDERLRGEAKIGEGGRERKGGGLAAVVRNLEVRQRTKQ